MSRLPDFLIIGAMKSATTTLHDQLAAQPGIFMSTPKEPCYFSNDEIFARGERWYRSLFAGAPADALCGESSTHYTKLPTYPDTVARIKTLLPDAKLIYIMRHPVQRLLSQFAHEWSERAVTGGVDQAVAELPRLTEYSLYSMQLEPYLDAFGPQRILPLFFERLTRHPQSELERVAKFIGHAAAPHWHDDVAQRNASSERLRRSPLRDALVWNPAVTWLRRALVPQRTRDWIKTFWKLKRKPKLASDVERRLIEGFDRDLARLSRWLGAELRCDNFASVAASRPFDFSGLLCRSAS